VHLLTLGNQVFLDADQDGVFNNGEAGVSGVTVELWSTDAVPALLHTDTTDALGNYVFIDLVPGTYTVELPVGNCAAGGPLVGFESSPGSSQDWQCPVARCYLMRPPSPSTTTERPTHC
jgi:hypothetical protein